ncbi:hypothetical protein HELRODRAFT_183450 [Helobdella robusta]|uniref:Uncharacterized protein n=1 Tax=Helobdella robusta TaxID=6412 RepID=T1FJP3_HELRO|nr:hypothetical protein HELRODRAFT_183450 [Helobdella robusta]ESO11138.1 hypothetical protein HELRODRAFT_183450 [Helobdella robusta]
MRSSSFKMRSLSSNRHHIRGTRLKGADRDFEVQSGRKFHLSKLSCIVTVFDCKVILLLKITESVFKPLKQGLQAFNRHNHSERDQSGRKFHLSKLSCIVTVFDCKVILLLKITESVFKPLKQGLQAFNRHNHSERE